MVDHMLRAVAEGEGGQDLGIRVAGVVLVAEMNGEVVGAVMTAAGGVNAGARVLAVDRELVIVSAVRLKIAGGIVGDGMAAAPVAIVIPALGQGMLQLCVARVVPGVGLAVHRRAGAAGIEHRAAVLRAVD